MRSHRHGIGKVHNPRGTIVRSEHLYCKSGNTHMAGSNDFILSIPDQAVEWKEPGGDIQHRPRGLLWRARVHHRDTTIMPGERKSIPARREAHAMNPSSRVIQEFSANRIERETLAPGARLWASIDTLDVAGEDSCMRISRSRS